MEQSLFVKYVQKFFKGVVQGIVTTLNDTKNPVVYYHKRFLKKEFSVDGKWESINAANTLVMADVVAMDSSLPLKKRDSLSRASGDIPKMGMELKLNEKQLTDLDTLRLKPETEPQLIAKLFQDTPRVIGGVFERNEAIFLEGLSTGVTVVDDSENVGTGIRIDYNYATSNKFGVAVLWSSASTATPIDDLERVKEQARTAGHIVTKFLMDRPTFRKFAKTTQVKELYANFAEIDAATVAAPSLAKLNPALQEDQGYIIEIIERTVRVEKNGVQTPVTPWASGAVVGITSEALGSLVWATLAEENHKVAGVEYEKADDYILVSKYRMNKPSLSEYTSSQARVVPVLTNTDQVYLVDSLTVQA